MNADERTVLDTVQTAEQVHRLHLGPLILRAGQFTRNAGEAILDDASTLRSNKLLKVVIIDGKRAPAPREETPEERIQRQRDAAVFDRLEILIADFPEVLLNVCRSEHRMIEEKMRETLACAFVAPLIEDVSLDRVFGKKGNHQGEVDSTAFCEQVHQSTEGWIPASFVDPVRVEAMISQFVRSPFDLSESSASELFIGGYQPSPFLSWPPSEVLDAMTTSRYIDEEEMALFTIRLSYLGYLQHLVDLCEEQEKASGKLRLTAYIEELGVTLSDYLQLPPTERLNIKRECTGHGRSDRQNAAPPAWIQFCIDHGRMDWNPATGTATWRGSKAMLKFLQKDLKVASSYGQLIQWVSHIQLDNGEVQELDAQSVQTAKDTVDGNGNFPPEVLAALRKRLAE